LECDGVLLNPEPWYWAGYSAVCAELGAARLDRASFWRAVRRGAQAAELLPGAKPARVQEYRSRIGTCLESPEATAALEPHAGMAAALERLRKHGRCSLVSTGGDRDGRQRVLDAADLSVHFDQMKALLADRARRVEQLRQLGQAERQSLVAVAGESLLLAAEEADLFVVGVAGGACTADRLRRFGARCVFSDLAELAACVEAGGAELEAAGFAAM